MNPYLREDIDKYIERYWHNIHKIKTTELRREICELYIHMVVGEDFEDNIDLRPLGSQYYTPGYSLRLPMILNSNINMDPYYMVAYDKTKWLYLNITIEIYQVEEGYIFQNSYYKLSVMQEKYMKEMFERTLAQKI